MSNQQQGVSILEVTIAAAVLLIAALATAQFFANSFRTSKIVDVLRTRDQIARRIEAAMNDPMSYFVSTDPNLQASCPNCNVALIACIRGSGNCANSANGIPFTLFALDNNEAIPVAGHEQLGSVYFGPDGLEGDYNERAIQQADADNFPFEARAYFRPVGVSGGVAESVVAQYQIIYRPPANSAERTYLRRTVGPNNESLFGANAASGAFVYPKWFNRNNWINVTEMESRKVNQLSAQNCGAGQVMTGFDRKGQPVCRCLGQSRADPNPNNQNSVLCEAAQCQNQRGLLGITDRDRLDRDRSDNDEDGDAPILLNSFCFRGQRPVCNGWVEAQDCATSGDVVRWVGGIKFDECFDQSEPSTKGGPPSATNVECTSKEVRCCSEAYTN